MKKSLSAVAMAMGVLMLMASAFTATAGPASAEHNGDNCEATYTKVVDKPTRTETVEHEAEYEYIEHPAVMKTIEGVWANWSPDDTRGPQNYTPIWPTDERGTWHLHDQLPPGHAGPDGVYQTGGGNSPWFYRQAGEVVIEKEAWTEKKLVKEAWTETIEHEATYKTVMDKPGHCETTTTTEPIEVISTVRPTTTVPPTTEPPVTIPPTTEPPIVGPTPTTVVNTVIPPLMVPKTTVVPTTQAEIVRTQQLAATGSSDSLPVLTLTGIGMLVLGVAMSRKASRI